jgi:superfamily II DNA or RNA helicase
VTWPVNLDNERISLHVPGRVSDADAARQEKTAAAILDRLTAQPGVVLADEVGMGKTFVAMAVAASAAWADKKQRPVVVMVPPSLKEKWPRDFNVFNRYCVPQDKGYAIRSASADDGVSFLKLLDDPRHRRNQIIFLTHGALSRGLTDPWTKLAIVKAALRSRRLVAQRSAFPRFAADIIRARKYSEETFRQLMDGDESEWRSIVGEDDDPVPDSVRRVLQRRRLDLRDVEDTLLAAPLRDSANREERLAAIRRSLSAPLRQVWYAAINGSRFVSPLLILDEAHHLKNPATTLASLFVTDDAAEDASELQGALEGRFERMLFLTATPFQLGHDELLRVLSRFRGIRWKEGSPTMSREDFDSRMNGLHTRLDDTQRTSLLLEDRWGTLREEDVPQPDDEWWELAKKNPTTQSERLQSVIRVFDSCADNMRNAEALLRPWVIRHLRDRNFAASAVRRRVVRPGAAIVENGSDDHGLPIGDDALLPFLLVARSQAVAMSAPAPAGALASGVRRLTFVEGLASSYEAYWKTREGADGGRTIGELLDEDASDADGEDYVERLLKRYFAELKRALPAASANARHPKIAPTVEQAVRLWNMGEKVLIFCHFRATGRSLERHVRHAIDKQIIARAARDLHCKPAEAKSKLNLLGEGFDLDRPAGRYLDAEVTAIVEHAESFTPKEQKAIADVIRRFVRTESFLVRFFPLNERDPIERVRVALDAPDDSGMSLRKKFENFVEFLASRPEERDEYLSALSEMKTRQNVRRATGETEHDQRRRLLLSFNTPFFPEVLIASSVLAEGVDLHLDCRYVIHHDLSWNPSTLEQRTGRVDRIGAKAEQVRKPINVFLPYLGGTQDEKMYLVVRDRERWFQVLMSNEYEMKERRKDKIAERIRLPESAARALAFKLDVS